MAFPTKGTVEAALQTLIDVAHEDVTRPGSRQLVREIKRVGSLVLNFEPTTYASLDLGEEFGE